MDNLSAALGSYPHTAELVGAPVDLGAGRTFVAEGLATAGGFPQMLRDLRHDVFEFPIVSYLVAKEHGAEVSAVPVFLTRRFVHATLVWNRRAGVNEPRDLEGRRVGIRYHGFTDGTWARGILSETFGVDLGRVTWVTSTPETVDGAALPPNVLHVEGAALDEMLATGDLAALVMAPGQAVVGPGIEPMFPDVRTAEQDWFGATGVLPILHTLVVKDSALRADPALADSLLGAFGAAKERAVARIAAGGDLDDEERAIGARRSSMGADPLPYGISANREALEMIVRFALEQRVLEEALPLEALFAPMDS